MFIMFIKPDFDGVRVAHLFHFFFVCVYWLSTVSLFVLCLGCPMLPLTPDHFYGSVAFLYLYNTESEISSCKHLIVGA